jgi:hypothetical protein
MPLPVPKSEPPPPAPRNRKLLVGGLALIAVGAVVGLGGGLGFGMVAKSKAAAIDAMANTPTPFDPSLDSDRALYQTLSITSLAVGGAAVVTGSVLVALWGRSGGPEKPRAVMLTPSVGPGSLALSGSF